MFVDAEMFYDDTLLDRPRQFALVFLELFGQGIVDFGIVFFLGFDGFVENALEKHSQKPAHNDGSGIDDGLFNALDINRGG